MNDPTAIYLYGLIAVPQQAGAAPLPLPNAAEVRFIAHDDVACAVCAVLASEYEAPQTSAAEQLAWVTPRAWRHHEVLSHLHASTTVAPLKFGTLCPDVNAVTELLRELHPRARTLLAHLHGKDEWTLTMSLDREALARELQASQAELLALDAEASALPDGRAYFVRKRRDRLAADLLASRLAAFELAIDDSLARLGVDIGWPEQRRETTAGAEAAVARKPLLVARDSFAALEDRLAAIEVEHAALHLQFELAGPLPPYSFTGDLDLKGSRPH